VKVNRERQGLVRFTSTSDPSLSRRPRCTRHLAGPGVGDPRRGKQALLFVLRQSVSADR